MAVPVLRDQPGQGSSGRGNVRALFDIHGFRRLLGVRLTSQFSDGLFQAALAGSVLFNPAQQSSPAKIATGFAVLLVPFSILGPFVGVFLDRWSRRNIIYIANVFRACLALPAAVLIWTGGIGVPFFACALLIAAINRFFLAGLSAALPHVVPEPLLVTNNATSSTLGTVAYSLGLGTTAVALHTILHTNDNGYGWLCVAAAVGYFGAAMLARVSFRRTDLGPEQGVQVVGTIASEVAAVARGMVAGARHLAQRRPVAAAMGVQALCRTLYGVLTIATLLLYSRFFYDNYTSAIGGLGQVVVVGSVGAVAAAFITPYATRSIGGRLWIIALTAMVAIILPPLALPFIPILLGHRDVPDEPVVARDQDRCGHERAGSLRRELPWPGVQRRGHAVQRVLRAGPVHRGAHAAGRRALTDRHRRRLDRLPRGGGALRGHDPAKRSFAAGRRIERWQPSRLSAMTHGRRVGRCQSRLPAAALTRAACSDCAYASLV